MKTISTCFAIGIVSLATALAACSPPPAAPDLTRSAETISRDTTLTINGEQIADQELWAAARQEGQITSTAGGPPTANRRCSTSSKTIPASTSS